MGKIKSITIILLLTLTVLIFANSTVFAANVNKTTYANSKITIEGTCTTSDQVQVIVFDLNNQPLYFATVEVKNNAFNKTLDASFNLEEGKTYTVKVADYSGTGVSQSSFVATAPDNNQKEKSDKDETNEPGRIQYVGLTIFTLAISTTGIILLKKKSI